MESRIERLCVERGLKMTGQRRVIARVLSDAEDHPDVEELYRRADCAGRSDLHCHRLPHRPAVGGEWHPGAAGFRRWPGPVRANRPWPALPPDRCRHRQGDRVRGCRSMKALMQTIAARLGFDLVSHRLELFGSKRVTKRRCVPKPARAKRKATEPGAIQSLTEPRITAVNVDRPAVMQMPGRPDVRSIQLRRAARWQSRSADRDDAGRGGCAAGVAIPRLLRRDGGRARCRRRGFRAVIAMRIDHGRRPPDRRGPCRQWRWPGGCCRHLSHGAARGRSYRRAVLLGRGIRYFAAVAVSWPGAGTRAVLRGCAVPGTGRDATAMARHCGLHLCQ